MPDGEPRFWRNMLLTYLFVGVAAVSVTIMSHATSAALFTAGIVITLVLVLLAIRQYVDTAVEVIQS